MHGWLYADMVVRLQRSALERMAELEAENAALKEAAQRRSAVLQQSRSFITSYLEVTLHMRAHGGTATEQTSCSALLCTKA